VDLADVFTARKRIAPYVRRTPLIESAWLSDLSGATVHLKLESQQLSNSFKSRGAFNAVIARLERGTPPARIVTASAGNHGRALAAACERFHLPLVVFTPIDAPKTKIAAITRHGAELRSEGKDYDDAEILAKQFAPDPARRSSRPTAIGVIAGAAAIAVEIFRGTRRPGCSFVPIGRRVDQRVAAAAKTLARLASLQGRGECRARFKRASGPARWWRSCRGHRSPTGSAATSPQTITFNSFSGKSSEIVTVGESDLAAAIVGLIEHDIVAGRISGAATAAIIGKRVDLAGRRVAVILSGA
jgi:threonine dehydratase